MSSVKFVVAVLTMLVAAVATATCPCNDSPPMANPGQVQYTCQEQKIWGKCVQGWMQGYCECACGVCAYDSEVANGSSTDMLGESVAEPMAEPAPKPKKTKKSKKSKKSKKNRKAKKDDVED